MIRKEKWIGHLTAIFQDADRAREIADRMEARFAPYAGTAPKATVLSEKDAMLITYGNTLKREGETGFATLRRFMADHVGDAISTIHFLPMFPYTSDDGFSVSDYREINPELGSWSDIAEIAKDYGMMFDAVINHCSKSHEWFRRYLACEKPYADYFHTCDPKADYSTVTRPRALPLLTEFETAEGPKHVWTTFSDDQIDLNYACPDVLIEMIDVLLLYASRGARFIRLDAIGFMWKELGTTCMHLPQTHEAIKLMRTVLEDYTPGTMIITETNVPHKDNISYFGNGDEAHLVYQFPLPPLTMFSLLTGSAAHLTEWAQGLEAPKPGTSFFNFLSSHDGIGVRPTEGILNEQEKQILVDATLRNGGFVSYKDNGDGTKSPYELNINYQDALASPEDGDEVRTARFIAAETILLSLQGLPGIYVHSLLGSRNDYYGRAVSGIPRRINREQLDADMLEQALAAGGFRQQIFDEMVRRLRIRGEHAAFSPETPQEVLSLAQEVFAVRRSAAGEIVTALINVSGTTVTVEAASLKGHDLLSGRKTAQKVVLGPYECLWIKAQEE